MTRHRNGDLMQLALHSDKSIIKIHATVYVHAHRYCQLYTKYIGVYRECAKIHLEIANRIAANNAKQLASMLYTET